MYQGAIERCINGPVLSGNSTPLNIMSTHVWEGEEQRKRISQFIFRVLNSAKHNAFQSISPFFLHSNKIFPVLDDLSPKSSIPDDLFARIFRHSDSDLQPANRMYQWKYRQRRFSEGRRLFFAAYLQNTFAQLVLISIYIPHQEYRNEIWYLQH